MLAGGRWVEVGDNEVGKGEETQRKKSKLLRGDEGEVSMTKKG
jgi:hypothetical protein